MARGDTRHPKVSLISLGCPRTLVDSEQYLGRLREAGFDIAETAEHADVAIQESVQTVLEAVELKRQGKLKAVVVAGCLVQRFRQDLARELPEVDGLLGVDGCHDIETTVREALNRAGDRSGTERRPRPRRAPDESIVPPRSALTPAHYAYLKVSEGCLKGCSFCIIPKIKGPLSSRPIEALLEETRQLVEERGVQELIVVGQDTSDYGIDRYGRPRIAELLGQLAKVRGLRWIRLLYCHPRGITPELIATIRDEPLMCKYLDSAIEHADDTVLARMNRGLTRAQMRETIATMRRDIPGLTLRTSVVVGFPGETEAAFETLLAFLREVQFERLGAFTYSREEGSASFRFPDQVPKAVARARFDRLMRLQQEIAEAVNARAIGRTEDVLIDEADPSDRTLFLGRTSADCPEVDGTVFVRSHRPLRAGEVVPVRITESYEYDLIGTVVTP